MQRNALIHLSSAILACVAISASIGCSTHRAGWTGPASSAAFTVSPWPSRAAPASVLTSQRYRIYTTLPGGARRDALPQVLEGAYAQYQRLAPLKPMDDRPLHCFIFADRREWEEFTTRRTGSDAAMYRQIPRGGYTIDDWFVAWSDHDCAIFSAAAHEGWHQYVSRHFKGRLPPFLEEGVGCLFENVRMEKGLPRWNTSVNPERLHALKVVVEHEQLWPLEELITLHAGDVVKLPRAKIEAFYGQSWAFARFLIEAEGGRYHPLFQAWLADTAAGKTGRTWQPATTRPVIERYLQQDFASIDRGYREFVTQITSRERAGR